MLPTAAAAAATRRRFSEISTFGYTVRKCVRFSGKKMYTSAETERSEKERKRENELMYAALRESEQLSQLNVFEIRASGTREGWLIREIGCRDEMSMSTGVLPDRIRADRLTREKNFTNPARPPGWVGVVKWPCRRFEKWFRRRTICNFLRCNR